MVLESGASDEYSMRSAEKEERRENEEKERDEGEHTCAAKSARYAARVRVSSSCANREESIWALVPKKR